MNIQRLFSQVFPADDRVLERLRTVRMPDSSGFPIPTVATRSIPEGKSRSSGRQVRSEETLEVT
jgi:hypothetical protein